jgi:hypothetical protein
MSILWDQIRIVRNVSILAGFTTGILRNCFNMLTVANDHHPAHEIALLNRHIGLGSRGKKRRKDPSESYIVISLCLNRTSLSSHLTANYYFSSCIASAQACCERYSLGHSISSDFHEMPESVEQNIPRLLAT